MKKKKKNPRWFRIVRYYLNCLWYHVLFPLGIEGDDFDKMIKENVDKKDG